MRDVAYGVIVGMVAALAGVVLGARLTAPSPDAGPAVVSQRPAANPGAPPEGFDEMVRNTPGLRPPATDSTTPAPGAPGMPGMSMDRPFSGREEGRRGAPGERGTGMMPRSPGAPGEGPAGSPGGMREGRPGGMGMEGAPSAGEPVAPRPPGAPLTFTGSILPRRVEAATAALAGPIARVLVREGQKVSKGAPLFEIEHYDAARRLIDAELIIKEAREQVARGESEPAALAPGARPFPVPEGRRGDVPGRPAAPAPSARMDPQTRLQVAEMDLKRARRAVQQATVRAPIAGVVQALPALGGSRQGAAAGLSSEAALPEVGATAAAGAPLCLITATGRPVITLRVNEMDLARIYGGQYAAIQPLAFPQSKLTGRVVSIGQAQQARPGSATFPVMVEVISPLGRVRHGMSARVTLLEKGKA